jgi:hypothetical protein
MIFHHVVNVERLSDDIDQTFELAWRLFDLLGKQFLVQPQQPGEGSPVVPQHQPGVAPAPVSAKPGLAAAQHQPGAGAIAASSCPDLDQADPLPVPTTGGSPGDGSPAPTQRMFLVLLPYLLPIFGTFKILATMQVTGIAIIFDN